MRPSSPWCPRGSAWSGGGYSNLTCSGAFPRVGTLPDNHHHGMSVLTPLSPFSVFLAIAAVGFLFLLISLVFGELFDHIGVDHDVEMGGPGFFSGRIMS